MKKLRFFIICSLIFHFLTTTSSLYFATLLAPSTGTSEPTQIEIIDKNKDELQEKMEKTRQLVKQLKASVQELKDSKALARYESEKTQRVEHETKARNLGVSQNSQPIAPTGPESKPDGEMPEFARQKTHGRQIPIAANSAISSTLDNDIQESDATNLNTDANTYYSFYSRVEELFYVRWVERVNYYWDRISFDYKKNTLAGKVWSTELEIWLTSTGEYHSAYLKKSSGYTPFDDAAVFAFKDAKLFPNPPRAKVEADGFVRLRYRFNVHVAGY